MDTHPGGPAASRAPGPVGTTARSGRPAAGRGHRVGHAALARLTALAALAAGCVAGPKLVRQREWVDLHPEAPDRIKRAVLGKKLIEGMTTDAVRASWGEPNETVELGGGLTRLTYVRRQELSGVDVNVEYMLVFDRRILIRIHRQKYR